jgi:hypothetical protein
MIAKLADGHGGTRHIDPHHLTTARNALLKDGTAEIVDAATRGGGIVPVLGLVDRQGKQRAFEDAAARKRLLYTRYAHWASRYYGAAGERVVHASLSVAAPQAGYRLFEPLRGEVGTIFGRPVPVGPLDNGGTLQLVDPHGRPTGSVVVLIEVKNVHHWMYASATELYELLDKATQLQMAIPDTGFVPVLVCRHGHPPIFRMAKDLGFMVADARAQYVLPVADVREDHVTELRTELGMLDLVRPKVNPEFPDRIAPYASKRLVKMFAEDLPAIAERSAERFKRAAPILAIMTPLLKAARPYQQRTLMARLRHMTRELRQAGGW